MSDDARPFPKSAQLARRERRREDRPDSAAASAWRHEVAAQGYALLSDTETGTVTEFQAHHLIPRQTLRRKARELGLPEAQLVWDARIGVMLSKRRHERHHDGSEPVWWHQLPPDRRYFAQMFAVEYGLEPWLERHMKGFAR